LSSSFSFPHFSFLLLLSNHNKKKTKDKSVPCVMCITCDDATRNGNNYNDVMKKKKMFEEKERIQKKKKMLEEKEKKQKKKEMMKKL